ncbi:MAG: hypothetical protein AAF447_15910 [Myxococcota bacterium]
MRPALPRLLAGLLTAALLTGALLVAPGCAGAREGAVGDACAHRNECASGLCVAGLGAEGARCTRSCRTSAQCPEGWSCSGVTDENVVICQPGAATPFGR